MIFLYAKRLFARILLYTMLELALRIFFQSVSCKAFESSQVWLILTVNAGYYCDGSIVVRALLWTEFRKKATRSVLTSRNTLGILRRKGVLPLISVFVNPCYSILRVFIDSGFPATFHSL